MLICNRIFLLAKRASVILGRECGAICLGCYRNSTSCIHTVVGGITLDGPSKPMILGRLEIIALHKVCDAVSGILCLFWVPHNQQPTDESESSSNRKAKLIISPCSPLMGKE